MSETNIDLLRKDECQPLTNEQMNDIKSQFHPSNTANVNIVPYEIYDEDGVEQVVGEVRKTVDGVKKKKPVYKKIYHDVNIETTFNETVGAGEATLTDNSLSSIDTLIKCGFIGKQIKNSGVSVCNSVNAQHRKSTTLFLRTPSDNNYIQHIIVTYTKTTDEWTPI